MGTSRNLGSTTQGKRYCFARPKAPGPSKARATGLMSVQLFIPCLLLKVSSLDIGTLSRSMLRNTSSIQAKGMGTAAGLLTVRRILGPQWHRVREQLVSSDCTISLSKRKSSRQLRLFQKSTGWYFSVSMYQIICILLRWLALYIKF